jgi:DNA-binding response OmpR family regulator
MTKQILVVDDDAQTRALVGLILQRNGFRTLEAFDGQSALRLLEFTTPDLIIVDIMMPGIDGLELCRRLRARHQTRETPVIVFTAAGSIRLDRSVRDAGANEFIPKTSPPQELSAAVNRLLQTNTVDALS